MPRASEPHELAAYIKAMESQEMASRHRRRWFWLLFVRLWRLL